MTINEVTDVIKLNIKILCYQYVLYLFCVSARRVSVMCVHIYVWKILDICGMHAESIRKT